MKLHKGKIRIVLAALVILTIISSVLCSFTLPNYDNETEITLSRPSEFDIENLMSIVDLQQKTGNFNNLIPVACSMNSSMNQIRLILLNPSASYQITVNGTDYTITQNDPTALGYYKFYLCLQNKGFTFGDPGDSMDGVSEGNFTSRNLLFYRSSFDSPLIVNPNFTLASGNGNDALHDIAEYWYDLYDLIINYESDIEAAESAGESIGYHDGYADGLDQGYEDGFSNGFDNGYRDGEYNGYAEGVSEGYSEGYRDGYVAGGSGSGPGEVETEIVYRDSVYLDIPLIFDGVAGAVNGIFSAVDFSLFGINILGVLLSITILVILVFVIKKFKS